MNFPNGNRTSPDAIVRINYYLDKTSERPQFSFPPRLNESLVTIEVHGHEYMFSKERGLLYRKKEPATKRKFLGNPFVKTTVIGRTSYDEKQVISIVENFCERHNTDINDGTRFVRAFAAMLGIPTRHSIHLRLTNQGFSTPGVCE